MVVVHCARHVCGLASAAIIARWGVLKHRHVSLGGVWEYSHMKNFTGSQLMFCDVPLRLIATLPGLTYCSSHQSEDQRMVNSLKKRGVLVDTGGTASCAKRLADRLLPHDGVARLLSTAADSVLSGEQSKFAENVHDILQAGYDAHTLVNLWRKGVLWPDYLQQFWTDAHAKKQQALSTLREHIDVRKHISTYLGFVRIPSFLSARDAAKEVLNAHATVDVAVVIAHDGHVTFRARDHVNVLEIAKAFGGGGQVYASGARIFDSLPTDAAHKLFEKIRVLFPEGLSVAEPVPQRY
ncbi:hypothetical protein HY490_01580 [Candidatus Woesearchaeota archaeon]|nr:hypothetical protein [Candidatus Woesearchaeota archaeon]